MRILYAAIDQTVPGIKGGSTHVQAVAEGLAALGHQVEVAVRAGQGGFPAGPVQWHDIGAPLDRPQLRLLQAIALRRLAHAVRPDVVIERYHNFGGEGLLAARATGAFGVLEVNAPVVDYPRSPKRIVDRLLVAEPMRRWRDWQCRTADLIVTPTPDILPSWTPRDRILTLEWGADVSRFRPGAPGRVPFSRHPGELIAIFAGAFRSWHGVRHLVDAMHELARRGSPWRAVLIGQGPQLPAVQQEIARRRLTTITVVGPLPYADMPAALAAGDIGVAPFDVTVHAPLRHTFYWSPLKLFEYMASGLPVVTPDLPRLRKLVGDGEGGVLYDPQAPHALADAIDRLSDPQLRERLAASARSRAVRLFSWEAHCRRLAEAIESRCP